MVFRIFKSIHKAEHPEAMFSLVNMSGKRMFFIDENCVYFDTIDSSTNAREQEIFSSNFISTTETVHYDIKPLDLAIRAFTKHRHYFCSIDFDQSINSIALKPCIKMCDDEAPTNILAIEQTDTTRAITEIIERTLLPIARQILN